jgi:hypothetical protein
MTQNKFLSRIKEKSQKIKAYNSVKQCVIRAAIPSYPKLHMHNM